MRRGRLVLAVVAVAVVATAAFACPWGEVTYFNTRHDGLPPALVETARVEGYNDTLRYWGDEITPRFDKSVIDLYELIKRNAAAGVTPNYKEKATFIAISGGGDNGAFTAGVMRGWTTRGDRPNFEVVTGVSTGALAAPFVFLGSAHDKDLEDIYVDHTDHDLYTSRGIFGVLGNALNSTKPLEALIRGYATDAFLDDIGHQASLGRRLLVATTNLDAQRPIIWDLTALAATNRPDRREMFVKVLLASSAIPGVFPPVEFRVLADDGKAYRELHVDGGVTAELIFIPPEVRLSEFEMKVFGGHRDRTLYVIRNGKLLPEYESVRDRLFSLAARSVLTMVKYQVLANLVSLERESKASGSAFFFQAVPPDFSAAKNGPFDRAYAKALFECGRKVGLAGTWSTNVPATPALVPHQAAIVDKKTPTDPAVAQACGS